MADDAQVRWFAKRPLKKRRSDPKIERIDAALETLEKTASEMTASHVEKLSAELGQVMVDVDEAEKKLERLENDDEPEPGRQSATG